MKKKKSLSTSSIVLIVAASVIALFLIVAGIFMIYVAASDAIYPNVYIAWMQVIDGDDLTPAM